MGSRSINASGRPIVRSIARSNAHTTHTPHPTQAQAQGQQAQRRRLAADDDGHLREQVWAVRGEPRRPQPGRGTLRATCPFRSSPFNNCLLACLHAYGPHTHTTHNTQVELGAEASAAFLAIFLPLYMVAHWRDWLPRVYSSRRFLYPKQTLPHETPPHRRHLLSWLTDSWPVGDKDILRYYGLDALLFLRSLRLQSLATLLCALYGLCVILPVNLHGRATLNSPPWCVRGLGR